MPRLFTGLEIPADLGQSLSLLRGGLPGARWIDPENYHLTLRFIGDVDDEIAQEIAWLLGKVRRKDFDLRLDGLQSFGGRKPRAIVAAVAPSPAVMELQAEHERLMQRVGLDPEGRKYTPHVTLARLRDSSSFEVAEYLSARAASARRRFRCRASCCSRRAPRSAAAPTWSKRPIRWRRRPRCSLRARADLVAAER